MSEKEKAKKSGKRKPERKFRNQEEQIKFWSLSGYDKDYHPIIRITLLKWASLSEKEKKNFRLQQ